MSLRSEIPVAQASLCNQCTERFWSENTSNTDQYGNAIVVACCQFTLFPKNSPRGKSDLSYWRCSVYSIHKNRAVIGTGHVSMRSQTLTLRSLLLDIHVHLRIRYFAIRLSREKSDLLRWSGATIKHRFEYLFDNPIQASVMLLYW